jgi:hypothetical protein
VEASYREHRVYVPRYIAQIGVPVVSFNVGFYWTTHYHDRPFFAERFRYERHGNHQAPGVAVALRKHRIGAGVEVATAPAKHGNIARYTARQDRLKTFAAAGPGASGKHRGSTKIFAAGRRHGPHPLIASGAGGKGGPQLVAGPKSKVAMGQRRGKCQGNGACQF